MKQKKKTEVRKGRPPKNGVTRDKMLPIRVSTVEFQRLKRLADEQGVTIAELLMKPYRKRG